MTEDQASDSGIPAEGQKPEGRVLEELQSLGHELAAAVKSLWESEESRRLRQEIGDGVVRLGQQIESAVQSAQESEAAKKLGDQVKGSVEKARESDVVSRLEQSLISGLQELNRQISKLVDPGKSPAQPIEEQEGEAEA
jgi:hypothetical protein